MAVIPQNYCGKNGQQSQCNTNVERTKSGWTDEFAAEVDITARIGQ